MSNQSPLDPQGGGIGESARSHQSYYRRSFAPRHSEYAGLFDFRSRISHPFLVNDFNILFLPALYQGLSLNWVKNKGDSTVASSSTTRFGQQKVLTGLPLKNIEYRENTVCLKENVFDFKDEMKKMFEKICISDYFFDVPYEDIWNMGIHMIVSKIKFKDLEHVLTILSSETSEIPVFCTKTFLSLKKSLEDVKLVDRLWIEHDRARGKIELSYDATKEQYVGIKVLSNIRFTSEDLGLAEEIYNLYEQGSIGKVKENNQKCVM